MRITRPIRGLGRLLSAFAAAGLLLAVPIRPAAAQDAQALAFPGAQGWAAHTPGGRGGRIIRVTTLAAEGPGSFAAAVNAQGPRIVVFEVGGVIDLGLKTIAIKEPFLTIAGQTAPHPGVTLIRGGIDIATHDVIVRHIRVRPGDGGLGRFAGHDFDAISTVRAHDVIVDHCSLTWGTDEGLSASGTRFAEGPNTTENFRNGTSRRITFSNNLVAEGLAYANHAKGEHSKGSLIHDHVQDVLIVGNLYAHNYERNPLFKGGVHGQIVNNLVYNPGARAMHYNLIAEEWIGHDYEKGEMIIRGNVLRAGKDTHKIALLMVGGSGDLDVFMQDNLAVDLLGEKTIPMTGRYTTAPIEVAELKKAPELPFGVKPLPSAQVQDAVIAGAGATPWDRDLVDRRIVADVIEGRGEIIDSQQEVGGYPKYEPTRKAFVEAEWNLDTMEPKSGVYPRGEPLR